VALSERILKPGLDVVLGAPPIDVKSEYPVHSAAGKTEAIDLVVFLPGDVIGIEVKIQAGACRKGQLAAQYQGLRKEITGRRVHVLFVHPGNSAQHKEVALEPGDRATSVSWGSIFECLSTASPSVSDPDSLVAALCTEAQSRFSVFKNRGPKRVRDDKLIAAQACLENAQALLNDFLRSEASAAFENCTWAPTLWRSPAVEEHYGPLVRRDGSKVFGPSLHMRARLDGSPDVVPIEVEFRIEKKGVAKADRATFAAKLPLLMSRLPAPLGKRGITNEGVGVVDRFDANLQAGALLVDGQPAEAATTEWLKNYAIAFLEYLLRPLRVMPGIPEG
jgi:hypothetical protein